MRRLISFQSSERGQVLIIYILIFGISMVLAAAVIDFGLWASERRGAQRDADLSALAGVRELAVINANASDAADAVDYAEQFLNKNDIGNASLRNPVLIDDSCFSDVELPGSRFEGRIGVPDSVTVDADHESAALFMKFLGENAPDIGARAKACAGANSAPGEILPIEVDNNTAPCFDPVTERPIFTNLCPLEFGPRAPSGAARGVLDLITCLPEELPCTKNDHCSDGSGSGDLEDVIIFTAPGICLINEGDPPTCTGSEWYDCAAVQTGNPKKILEGMQARLASEGVCDGSDADDIDGFDESVIIVDDTGDPSTSMYQAKDCDAATPGRQISPRLVTIIVLDAPPDLSGGGSGTPYPIIAFAGFYIEGCASDKNDVDGDGVVTIADMDPKCDVGGSGSSPPAHLIIYGTFVNLITENAAAGPVSPSTTAFGISLVE